MTAREEAQRNRVTGGILRISSVKDILKRLEVSRAIEVQQAEQRRRQINVGKNKQEAE